MQNDAWTPRNFISATYLRTICSPSLSDNAWLIIEKHVQQRLGSHSCSPTYSQAQTQKLRLKTIQKKRRNSTFLLNDFNENLRMFCVLLFNNQFWFQNQFFLIARGGHNLNFFLFFGSAVLTSRLLAARDLRVSQRNWRAMKLVPKPQKGSGDSWSSRRYLKVWILWWVGCAAGVLGLSGWENNHFVIKSNLMHFGYTLYITRNNE